MKGGKQIKSQIDNKTSIQSPKEEAAYKYLGVDEKMASNTRRWRRKQPKNIAAKEYYRRVRLIPRPELNSKNKLSAIDALQFQFPRIALAYLSGGSLKLRKWIGT